MTQDKFDNHIKLQAYAVRHEGAGLTGKLVMKKVAAILIACSNSASATMLAADAFEWDGRSRKRPKIVARKETL